MSKSRIGTSSPHWVLITALMALLLGGACQTLDESGDPLPKRDITDVMEAHVDELMAISGVTGVAIGALDDGTPCVLVLVLEDTEGVREKIPKALEGHPVKIFESGEIRPMEGQ